ncbi:MAG TPA: aminotransferase class I/II-fold pyridoxal phosphate-dependent enzyme [Polyangiaceae bacterium]|nr:aminotransferase class I/II-fold pyridoxal phosphate-dependent enzyme [Polyangiaceae bacterium]
MAFVIPSRSARPSDDPIFALNAEARARAQAGESVINATVGSLLDDEGRIATLPGVVAALAEVPAPITAAYAPIAGSPDFLRGVIADLLGTRPEASSPDSPLAKWATGVATTGGTGALRHAIANFLEPGQALLTSSFYWGPYKTLADETDRALATFNMFDEAGKLDVAAFRRSLESLLRQQGRALVILNSPCHNPTGYSFDKDEWAAVRSTIEDLSGLGPITICLDIAYARFGPPGGMDAMLDAVLPLVPRALVTFAWSASKTFLEYGIRVGALIAVHSDDEIRRKVQNALVYSCRGTWSNVNAGGMSALATVLSTPSLRTRVDAEREQWVSTLARRVARWNELASKAELRYPRYDGGFFTTVFTDDAFGACERLKALGVFVVPQAGALRVALCSVAERDIERLVQAIAKATRP